MPMSMNSEAEILNSLKLPLDSQGKIDDLPLTSKVEYGHQTDIQGQECITKCRLLRGMPPVM